MSISNFKVVVVGMGVQGNKRAAVANKDLLTSIDIDSKKAKHSNLDEIDSNSYDAVLLCTPDDLKYDFLKKIITKRKHVLVEKPLFTSNLNQILELEKIAIQNNVILYTAYNHRFEPHFINMKSILERKEIGNIFRLRMFYGNGTSGLVKQSPWRDKKSGVILDIGSHLLDTLIFWFGNSKIELSGINSFCFENLSPDHAILSGKIGNIFFELEVSLLSWRNDFNCDIIGSKGSAHINSLCKWGPSKIIKRSRVLPAGRPDEEIITLNQSDPTWTKEYVYFKRLISTKAMTDLSADKKIFNLLQNILA